MAEASTSGGASPPMVRLVSEEGSLFEIPRAVAMMFCTVKNFLECDDVDGADAAPTIPISMVKADLLAKIIAFARSHHDNETADPPPSPESAQKIDAEFVSGATAHDLIDIIAATNYLDYKHLMNLACKTTASMIKGKTVDEIRATFGIENDLTPEEEEEIRKENMWAFD